jgi:O-antigen ligase
MAKTIKRPTPVATSDYWFYLTILAAVFISIRFDSKTQDPFNLPKFAVLLLALWLPLYLFSRKIYLLKRKLPLLVFLASVGFVITLVFSGLNSGNFYGAMVGVYLRNLGISTYLFFVILFIGVGFNFNLKNYKFALISFASLGTMQTIYGLIQQLGADPIPWNNPYNPMLGTFGNPNFASSFLGISAVACLVLVTTSKIPVKFFLVTQIVVSMALVINSNSSQGLLAFVSGISVFGLGFIYLNFRRVSLPILIVVGAGGFIGLLGLLEKGPLQFLYEGSIAARGDYWRAAISMWKSSPLTGVGLERYGDFFGVHRDTAQVIGRGYLTQTDNAHNTFLHLLATTGLLGFAFYLLLHLIIAVAALFYLRKAKSIEFMTMLSTFSIWISFVSINLISPDNLGVTVWQWVFAGLVLGQVFVRDIELKFESVKNNYIILMLCIALTTIPSVFLVSKFVTADKCVWKAYAAGYSGQKTLSELNKLMSDCISNGPKEDRYLALAASFSIQVRDFKQATIYTTQLADQNPRNSEAYRLAAYALEALGEFQSAIASRKRLEELNPMQLENLKVLSLDYIALGDIASAMDYRNKIKSVDPMSGFIQEIDLKIAGQN